MPRRQDSSIATAPGLRVEQLAAAFAAIALNLAAAWLLARDEAPQLRVQVGGDHVIQLVFLEREPDPVAIRVPVSALRQPTETPTRRTPPQETQARTSKPAADDASSSPVGTTGRPLDLSIADAAIFFERKPLTSKEALISEAPIRMPLAFTDRSFGGVMQRHGTKMLCHELKSALRNSPGSASSILASMQEQGCRH